MFNMDRNDVSALSIGAGIVATISSFWLDLDPLIRAWFWMAGIDVAAGLLVAISTRTLNMEMASKGASKKAMVLLMIGTGAVLDIYAANQVNLPVSLAGGVAGAYAVREFLSILQHATSLGLSIPEPLASVAARFAVSSTPAASVQVQVKVEAPPSSPTIPPPPPAINRPLGTGA